MPQLQYLTKSPLKVVEFLWHDIWNHVSHVASNVDALEAFGAQETGKVSAQKR